MIMRTELKWAAVLAVVASSYPAHAQSGPAAQASGGAGPPVRAEDCIGLMDGRVPIGQDAGRLRVACENLLRSATVQPGVAQGTAQAGESVQASFTQAGKELIGQSDRPTGLGATARGPVTSTLMTNPLGWFSGLGVNVSYERPFDAFNKLSWVALASFSRTSVSIGNASTAGLGGGVDFFLIGQNNEGLRIGPRLSTYFGTETIQGSTTFARLGGSAEVGYNHIASNGITGSAALGYGGRLAGDAKNDSFAAFTGGEAGLYVTAGVGYSW
jgi:hypothetical protein